MTTESDWEGLYRETRHRIGNTMQMLLSLLRLQMRKEGAEARDALARLELRMSAAAAAYALARIETGDAMVLVVDYAKYIGDMVEEARRQLEPDVAPEVMLDLAAADIPLDQAIPVGVALTEVLVAAVRRDGPQIHVRLDAGEGGAGWRLTVADGGAGIVAEGLKNSGLGLRIAESLMRQVKGRLILDAGPVCLEWPEK